MKPTAATIYVDSFWLEGSCGGGTGGTGGGTAGTTGAAGTGGAAAAPAARRARAAAPPARLARAARRRHDAARRWHRRHGRYGAARPARPGDRGRRPVGGHDRRAATTGTLADAGVRARRHADWRVGLASTIALRRSATAEDFGLSICNGMSRRAAICHAADAGSRSTPISPGIGTQGYPDGRVGSAQGHRSRSTRTAQFFDLALELGDHRLQTLDGRDRVKVRVQGHRGRQSGSDLSRRARRPTSRRRRATTGAYGYNERRRGNRLAGCEHGAAGDDRRASPTGTSRRSIQVGIKFATGAGTGGRWRPSRPVRPRRRRLHRQHLGRVARPSRR